MSQTPSTPTPMADNEKVGIGAYISLAFAIVFFSGLCASKQWWGVFDFTTLNGGFGQLLSSVSLDGETIKMATASFRGKGGSGAIDGFMFAITLVPTVMFALAMITVFEYYGALRAARKILTPVLRPILGLPGGATLALIASLQSTDGGAALTRQLKDSGELTPSEVKIFSAFQMTADAAITNFFSSGAVIFTLIAADGKVAVPVSLGLCLGVILLGKLFAGNVMRLLVLRDNRKNAAAAPASND